MHTIRHLGVLPVGNGERDFVGNGSDRGRDWDGGDKEKGKAAGCHMYGTTKCAAIIAPMGAGGKNFCGMDRHRHVL